MADELRASGPDEVLFVGTPTGPEARLVPEAGVSFFGVPAAGFDRSRPLSLIVAGAVLVGSMLRALTLLRRFRPDVVAGFGGYVSLPVGFAAVIARIPLVLHEQNSVPGMTNRVLSRWARAVGATYPASAARFAHPERVETTGNPVRASVLASTREGGRATLGVPEGATLLLVFGGSRGARHINAAVTAMRDQLMSMESLHVLHIAGRDEAQGVRADLAARGGDAGGRYRVVDYLDDMGSALAACDVVVARAGATTIAEITAVGRAAVLVPYPYATDDHQTLNAAALRDSGAAVVIPDAELDSSAFAEALLGLLGDPVRRASMAAASHALAYADAGARVARLVRRAAGVDMQESTGDGVSL